MKKYILSVILCTITLVSCVDDDYKLDGGISQQYVNMSTYDYLKSHPYHYFDTLVMSIDKTGLKEAIDGEVTLFATSHFSFRKYIDIQTTRGRDKYGDQTYRYTFDSIPDDVLRDSLSMYIFEGKMTREYIMAEGELDGQQGIVATNIIGTNLRISLQPQDDYKDQLKEKPRYVYLTYKRGKNWDKWDDNNVAAAEIDTRVRIQTSNLISTTGVIHVMENSHTLFFDKN